MRASGAPTNSGTTSAQTAPLAGFGRGGIGVGQDWAAALELTIATNGAEPYKSRLKELFPQMITPQQMGVRGWTSVRALPYLDASAKDQMREAVKTYMADLDKRLDATPFGVPPSLGTWGGSGAVMDMAIRMYFLHKTFPDLVSPDYTLRAVNYILGTHPVSSTSYVAGVGTVSKTMTYSNNRADNAYIPGEVIPGSSPFKIIFAAVKVAGRPKSWRKFRTSARLMLVSPTIAIVCPVPSFEAAISGALL